MLLVEGDRPRVLFQHPEALSIQFADGIFQQGRADALTLHHRLHIQSAYFTAAVVQEALHHAVVVDEDAWDEVSA